MDTKHKYCLKSDGRVYNATLFDFQIYRDLGLQSNTVFYFW
jgi:hypothetical protein